MCRADQSPREMRDDEPHKAYGAAGRNQSAREQREHQKVHETAAKGIDADCDSCLFAEQQPVQGSRLTHEKERGQQNNHRNEPDILPAGAGQRSHGPELNRHDAVGIAGDRNDEIGKGGEQRIHDHAGENQLYRGGFAVRRGEGEHQKAGKTRAEKRPEARHNADAEKQGARCAERRSGRHTENIRVCHWILHDRLHHAAAERKTAPREKTEDNSRHADLPDNLLHRNRNAATALPEEMAL